MAAFDMTGSYAAIVAKIASVVKYIIAHESVAARQILDRWHLAAERIARVPRIAERLEPHRARIDHQQAPDQTFAEADDFADHSGSPALRRPS